MSLLLVIRAAPMRALLLGLTGCMVMLGYYVYFMQSVWKREHLSRGYRIFAIAFTSIPMAIILLGALSILFVIIWRLLGLPTAPIR